MARPIERVESRAGERAWHVTRHAEVKALLGDERLGMENPMSARMLAAPSPRGTGTGRRPGIGQLEYRVHTAWRKAMNKVFSARAFDTMIPVIHAVSRELTRDLMRAGPPADLHDGYSVPLAARVICALLDVPVADIGCFRQWAGDGQDGVRPGPPPEGMSQFVAYAEALVADRRPGRADDPVSLLLGLPAGSTKAQEGRVVRLLAGMLAFGWQTPASMLDAGALLLFAHPAQRQLLRQRPALSGLATEEILRLARPPNAVDGGVHRQAHADVSIGEVTIGAGDMVLLDLVEANRDRQVFAEPECFDITRDPNPHLSFGHAFYMCNFARLARTEIGIGLANIFTGIPGLRAVDQAALEAPGATPWLTNPGKVLVTW